MNKCIYEQSIWDNTYLYTTCQNRETIIYGTLYLYMYIHALDTLSYIVLIRSNKNYIITMETTYFLNKKVVSNTIQIKN